MLYRFFPVFLILAFAVSDLSAQNTDVPPSLQAAVYKKLLSMDKEIAAKGRGKIMLVTERMTPSQYEFSKSLEEVGILVTIAKSGAIPEDAVTYSAIYFTSANLELAQKFAGERVLIIGSESSLVENGTAGLTLANIDGKVKPIISASFVTRSGHTALLAALSKTARILP